jgi:hypothetical protein
MGAGICFGVGLGMLLGFLIDIILEKLDKWFLRMKGLWKRLILINCYLENRCVWDRTLRFSGREVFEAFLVKRKK